MVLSLHTIVVDFTTSMDIRRSRDNLRQPWFGMPFSSVALDGDETYTYGNGPIQGPCRMQRDEMEWY